MDNRLMVRDGDYLAVFNSAHRVMKAENILKSKGVAILLIPAPRQLMTDCGLALRFSSDNRDIVMEILNQEELMPAFINRYIDGRYVNEFDTQGDI